MCEVPGAGSMTTSDDHIALGAIMLVLLATCVFCLCRTLCGEAFKLRGSPKASPTTHVSKGMMGTEGNDLKRVKAGRMSESEMGNPQPSPSVPGLF